MKPAGPVAHRADYKVRDAPLREAARLISAYHYARGCSNTAVFVHGLYRVSDDALVGAALWLPPTKPCAMSVHRNWRDVLALSRLVVAPGEPKNAAGILLGGSTRLVQQWSRWVALVTFADLRQGHTGTIYRATGWRDNGLTKPEPVWELPDGRQVSRLATRSRTAGQMVALGARMVGRSQKRKFVKILKATELEV